MKRKMIAAVLAISMVLGLTACGSKGGGSGSGSTTTTVSGETEEVAINGITYNKATDLTTDEIELTYFHFDQDETVQYLAERFMELYPNIKVNVVYEMYLPMMIPYLRWWRTHRRRMLLCFPMQTLHYPICF